MALIKICEKQEKWDLDFYRNVVPRAILEIQNVDTIFEMLVHALSEFHHKLSIVVFQLPCEFHFRNIRALQEKISSCASQMLTENKYQTIKLAALVKQLKQILFDLNLEHRQSSEQIQSLEQKLERIRQEQRKHKQQSSQMERILESLQRDSRLELSFSGMIDLRKISVEKKYRFERKTLQKIQSERLELQKKQQILIRQYNKKMKNCFSSLNQYIEKVLRYKKECPFETFNRNNSNQINTTDGIVKQNQLKRSANISQFSHDQPDQDVEMKCTIQAAQEKSEREGFWPILAIPTKMILEDAMIAISQHEQSEGSQLYMNEENDPAKP